MKKTLLALSLIGASTSVMANFPTPVYSNEPREQIYGGLSINQDRNDGERAASYSVHVGTGIFPLLGRIEVGYLKHGDFETVKYNGTKLTDVDASSFYLAGKPTISFGKSSFYGKVGITKTSVNGKKEDDTFNGSHSGLIYGVGYEYLIHESLSLGAGYQRMGVFEGAIDSITFNATLHYF